MKTVVIKHGFSVDEPKPAKFAVGDEPTVADAVADLWVSKGLAEHKAAPKAEKPSTPVKSAG